MKTSQLFGIKFARKYKYKVLDLLLRKYIESRSSHSRNYEDIASDLWENIKVEAARTNWQHVYEKVLGRDIELPNQQVSLHISRKDTKELFRDYNCKHYYFTDTAIQECEKVYITELDPEWLRDVKDGKRQLNWGDQFIRLEKKNNRIVAIAASFTRRQEHKFLQHTFFVLDLNEPKLRFDPIADIVKEQCENDLDYYPRAFENKMRMLLYKMLTFLDLIPVKKIKLPGWGCLEGDAESLREVKHIEPVYNNENIDITVVTVNVNWNCSIYIEETTVTEHFRNVVCRGKKIRRFIKEHERSDHWRLAGKLKSASNMNKSGSEDVVKLEQKPMVTANNSNLTGNRISIFATDQQKSQRGERRYSNSNSKQKVCDANSQQKKQVPLHPFYAKLEELKKKFHR